MAKRKYKILNISLISFAVLGISVFFLNWYMTYRLESKLRKSLSQMVSKATNGFYHFSFDNLSIGLFSGELSMHDIKFIPDSLVFRELQNSDSLPNVYYEINIGKIHFKGINLTWRKDYKELKFSVFEIDSPNIKVFNSISSTAIQEGKHDDREVKTLYEFVSPYINMLTVNKINLTNANVSYTIADSVSSVIYALKEANFHAYNFLLDRNSSVSGKLLYSDNFEFTASTPQCLLYSDHIILNTNDIQLSTIDSIIQIEGVNLQPKDELWGDRFEIIGGYLNATVGKVKVDGLDFKREEGLNYLHARSFIITSTNIEYCSVKKTFADDTISVPVKEKGVTDRNWSLYTILSPILNSVSIEKIGVEKTKFNYTHTQDNFTDIYTLGNFYFQANSFLIDSLSEKQKKFWYVDNFTMIGDDINGMQRSNNAEINVKKLYLSSIEQKFEISDITINPLSTFTAKDYLSGSIKSISVDGLEYNTGVFANQINITSPNIEYFKVANKAKEASFNKNLESSENILDFFIPYADFLSVKDINLSNASLVFHDKRVDETYRLNNLNFHASDFLIDEHTRKSSPYIFTCYDIGFSIKNFDNILPGKDYRLQIDDADVSTRTGKIILLGVKLTPQQKLTEQGSTVIDASSSLIKLSGFNNNAYMKDRAIAIADFLVESPHVKIVKGVRQEKNNTQDFTFSHISSIMSSLLANNVSISDARFIYIDKEVNDSLKTDFSQLKLSLFKWNMQKIFNISDLILKSPHIYYTSHNKKNRQTEEIADKSFAKLLGNNVNIGSFIVSDFRLKVDNPSDTLKLEMKQFDFSQLAWKMQDNGTSLGLDTVNLIEPIVDINKTYIEVNNVDSQRILAQKEDVYSFVEPYFNYLSVKGFNLTNANINYTHALSVNKQRNQVVNKTNLYIQDFTLDTKRKKYDLSDIRFNTKDLFFPIMDGFYTLGFGNINIDKKGQTAEVSNISMISAFPKSEFAYKHPKNKDWLDITVGNVLFSELDYAAFSFDNRIKAGSLTINDVVLQNLKNKQIKTQHRLMPMIYEKIQQLPIKLDIDTANIYNFSVLYEELPREGHIPGKIYFDNMNAGIKGLTNIPSYNDQFINIDVDGKFMNGSFIARWDVPVSPDYDCFVLEAYMKKFDLRNLNDILVPLAKAEVRKGILQNLYFRTEASSIGATAEMRLLYNDLQLSILKDIENKEQNKFLSKLANIIVRSNNPNRRNSKPRDSYVTLERDPYHSTFNYFWQILQPPIAESVGVSKKKQGFAKSVSGFFSKVKTFFTGKKEVADENNEGHSHE